MTDKKETLQSDKKKITLTHIGRDRHFFTHHHNYRLGPPFKILGERPFPCSEDFIPKEKISLKNTNERLAFAQSIAENIFGKDVVKLCPVVWEEDHNKRFNLHPPSNDWWLYLPGNISKNWRLVALYTPENWLLKEFLAPFAESFIEEREQISAEEVPWEKYLPKKILVQLHRTK